MKKEEVKTNSKERKSLFNKRQENMMGINLGFSLSISTIIDDYMSDLQRNLVMNKFYRRDYLNRLQIVSGCFLGSVNMLSFNKRAAWELPMI